MYSCRYTSKPTGGRTGLHVLLLLLLLCTACGRTEAGTADRARLLPGDADAAFEYRGLYTPSNATPQQMAANEAHNVDHDWLIWGHNLRKTALADGVPEEAFATVDGRKDRSQLCFSSEALHRAVVAYIRDNVAQGETARVALVPDDNDLACTCEACRRAGNTPQNATPAVACLLGRLAREFPQHLFFTTAYLTTRHAPKDTLPPNTGVLISAMELPMKAGVSKGKKAQRFAALVADWQRAVPRVYVWDYVRNFDDYLTPFPCLRLVQQRLLWYRDMGVRGIFLNGSGNSYASFDDVQTHTLACLLKDPEAPVDTCVAGYLRRHYPVTGEALARHYLAWEDQVLRRKALLPWYGGIGDAVQAWLDPDGFEAFHTEADALKKKSEGDERRRLNRLLTALQFTRLELLRRPHADYDAARAAECLELLAGHEAFGDMAHYREADGPLDIYRWEWRCLMAENAAAPDALQGVRLDFLSQPDGGYADASLLTDGRHALPTDYHTGWIISSAPQTVLQVPAGAIRSHDVVQLSFLSAPRWRIHLPRTVELWQEGRKVGEAQVPANAGAMPWTKHKLRCKAGPVSPAAPVEIRVTQGKGGRKPTIALDEIDVF